VGLQLPMRRGGPHRKQSISAALIALAAFPAHVILAAYGTFQIYPVVFARATLVQPPEILPIFTPVLLFIARRCSASIGMTLLRGCELSYFSSNRKSK